MTPEQRAALVPSMDSIEIRDTRGNQLSIVAIDTQPRDEGKTLVIMVELGQGWKKEHALNDWGGLETWAQQPGTPFLPVSDDCPDCGVHALEFHRPNCPRLPPTGLQVIR